MTRVSVARSVVIHVLAHAREAFPSECCGVLIGMDHRIIEAIATRNVSDHPSRFLIDPGDHIRARRLARVSGREVSGFYHSHPRSAAYPSARDLAESAYPDAVHLIAGPMDGQPEVRAYRISDGGAAECEVALFD